MSDRSVDVSPDRMEASTGGHQPTRWLLLTGNRLQVTALLAGAVFVTFVLGADSFAPAFTEQARAGDMIDTMFSTMITVIVTGATLVVTIGQLVLAQENGPLGDQRDRMSNSMDVREFTRELTGSPSPTDPAGFLGQILATTGDRAEQLGATTPETGRSAGEGPASNGGRVGTDIPAGETAGLERKLDHFVENVREDADVVREQLDGAEFGSFDVLFAALGFDYSHKLFWAEWIETEYEGQLTGQQEDLLDGVRTALALFGPAREHVKTLYFQWALIELSRLILYTAVPAVSVAGLMMAVVDIGTIPGSTLGFEHLLLVVAAAFAVTLLPFVLFVSYVLRVLTVAKRTLAIEPLILEGTGR
jgi:hypothetical protein